MASLRWRPRALAVAQVNTITIGGTWVAADTVTVTCNQKSLVLTVGSTVTTSAIATAVKEMINGDDISGNATRSETGNNVPEFAEVAATVLSNVVSVTGNVKGRPFTISVTKSSSSGTAVGAVATAATGPNHYDNAINYDSGSLPADGDTLYYDNCDVSVLYGLDASTIEPAAVFCAASFTGEIGLPEFNEDGGYAEYRDRYIKLGPVILRVGMGEGRGSGRIKWDSGADPCAITIINTGDPLDDVPAFIWKGSDSGNTLVVRDGSVGVAVYGPETATLSTFAVENGELTLGKGVTLSGALTVNDGDVAINSAIATSLTMLGGNVVIDGTGAVAQLTIRGGTCVYKTTGTLGGAPRVSEGGVLDFSQQPVGVTVTNPIDLFGTAAHIIDSDKVVATLVVDFNEGAKSTQVEFGTNVRLTRGAVA